MSLGLHDVVRERWPSERIFTYWDYRAGMFHKDLGMRIDLALASAPVAARVKAAWVDRQARKGTGPSDHAPVMVDLDEAPDGDIGPVVPPPSAKPARRGSARCPSRADPGGPAAGFLGDRVPHLGHLLERAQVVLVEDDVAHREVLLQMGDRGRARDEQQAVVARQEPRQGDLRGGGAVLVRRRDDRRAPSRASPARP